MNNPAVETPALIVADLLTRSYTRGRESIHALDRVSFTIRKGAFVAVVGPSGSGKTTLLNLLGCMDAPTSGSLTLNGREVRHFTDAERTRFRREHVGFVFQHFGLLPTLTVEENIALPLLFSGRRAEQSLEDSIQRVGLSHRRRHLPRELSGGEMQRVAIARALVHNPSLLLADEPTGNLDSATGETITALFRQLHADGLTIVVVTHNSSLAAMAQHQLRLRDGRLDAC